MEKELHLFVKRLTLMIIFFVTSLHFSYGQCLSQSFEDGPADTWSYTGTPTLLTGNGVVPNTPRASDGTTAWVAGGENGIVGETLDFACQDITGLEGVAISFDFAGFGSATNSIDPNDEIEIYISLDGGVNYSYEVELNGVTNNQNWSHGDGGAHSHTYDGDNSRTILTSATGMGPSSITINIPDVRCENNLCLRLHGDTNRDVEEWAIDNIQLNTTNGCTPSAPVIADLVITEIMIDPCSGTSGTWPNEGDAEFIEIYNNGTTAIDLFGYELRDALTTSVLFAFPDNASIAAGTSIVVGNTPLITSLGGPNSILFAMGTSPRQTNGALDGITLNDCMGTEIDNVIWDSPTCMTGNIGVSAVLMDVNADNSDINAANWFPSFNGGGTPGGANTAGSCIDAPTITAGPTCNDAVCDVTIDISFDSMLAYSGVTMYDIYIGGVLNQTVAAPPPSGTGTATITLACPTTAGTQVIEVRPASAPANPCFAADRNANIPDCSLVPLPVELSSFTAKADNYMTNLYWNTLSEVNNDYFVIEHSITGRDFKEVSRVKGAGTTNIDRNYSFTHKSPVDGVNYYRLKQVDFDGTYDYSSIEAVTIRKTSLIRIFPSIANNVISVDLLTTSREDRLIKIYNAIGHLVASDVIPAYATRLDFDITDLPIGHYYLSTQIGKELVTERFLKID